MFLDAILSLLQNGKWHDVREIPDKVGLPEVKTGIIIAFLAEYCFIELDDKKEKARASKTYLDFVKRISWVERAHAAGKRLE